MYILVKEITITTMDISQNCFLLFGLSGVKRDFEQESASHGGETQHSQLLDFRWDPSVNMRSSEGQGGANCALNKAEE